MTSLEKGLRLRRNRSFPVRVAARDHDRQRLVPSCQFVKFVSRTLETAGANRLRDAQAALDAVVRAAYGMKDTEETLAFLLRLNLDLSAQESKGNVITAPGLPKLIPNPNAFASEDCVQPPAPGFVP
jgi:hypothetical protein